MIATWWLDVGLFGALLLLFYIIYFLTSQEISESLPEVADIQNPSQKEIPSRLSWMYPDKLIRQAGILPRPFAKSYWISKFYLSILVILVVNELYPQASFWLHILPAFLAGFFSIDGWLVLRRRKRQQEITQSLSFFLDLIVAYLKSGTSLTQALQQAALFGLTRHNPLAQEVSLISREINAGRERNQAFYILAMRSGVDEIKRLASVMETGFKTGSSVISALTSLAGYLHSKQQGRLNEIANRKSMQALLPMMMVSLPMFLVIVLFPAVIQVQQVYQLLKGIM